jgi:hypothetical protein
MTWEGNMPKSGTAIRANGVQTRLYSSSSDLQARIWRIIRTLSHIDADYYLRLDEAERSATDEDFKRHVEQTLKAAHRERRQPYVYQLEELRQQQHRRPFGI